MRPSSTRSIRRTATVSDWCAPSCCFTAPARLPDEEEQYAVYRRIVEWAHGKPVTIRTLDAGGDKPIPGYTLQGESNPFLGVRGVRLSLRHPSVLETQLRALTRAAALGPLKVMVPMITRPLELDAVRKLLEKAGHALRLGGVPVASPALGMMVEVPAAAIAVDLFHADFLSIGSNDLIQYLTACGRDTGELGALQDPLQPAVLRLIRNVVEYGTAHGIEVSLCGDMAAEVPCLEALAGSGAAHRVGGAAGAGPREGGHRALPAATRWPLTTRRPPSSLWTSRQ